MSRKQCIVRNSARLFDKTYVDKINIAKLFRSKCALCGRKISLGTRKKINFTFHHFTYDPKELNYKDFKNSAQYNEYILPIVKKILEILLYFIGNVITLLRWLKNIQILNGADSLYFAKNQEPNRFNINVKQAELASLIASFYYY